MKLCIQDKLCGHCYGRKNISTKLLPKPCAILQKEKITSSYVCFFLNAFYAYELPSYGVFFFYRLA